MTNSEWAVIVQAVATVVLVGVTAWYAIQTHKTTKEMQNQRYDMVRPVIDTQWEDADGKEKEMDRNRCAMAEAKGNLQKLELPTKLTCILRNVGVGTATDVFSFIQDGEQPDEECYRLRPLGPLEITDAPIKKQHLFLNQRNGRKFLAVYYVDAYGRCFESVREVTRDVTGTLIINPPKLKELPKKIYKHLVEGNRTTFVDKLWPPSKHGGKPQ